MEKKKDFLKGPLNFETPWNEKLLTDIQIAPGNRPKQIFLLEKYEKKIHFYFIALSTSGERGVERLNV